MYKQIFSYSFLLVWLLTATVLQAQIDTVRIGVTGLTCSSCSKAVEEKMLKLDCVKSVLMDLNTNEATVIVDFSKHADWNKLATSVYDAGFSVGYVRVPSCMKMPQQISDVPCEDAYLYVGAADKRTEHGYYTLVGKYFMSSKEYAAWKKILKGMTYIEPAIAVYYYY